MSLVPSSDAENSRCVVAAILTSEITGSAGAEGDIVGGFPDEELQEIITADAKPSNKTPTLVCITMDENIHPFFSFLRFITEWFGKLCSSRLIINGCGSDTKGSCKQQNLYCCKQAWNNNII